MAGKRKINSVDISNHQSNIKIDWAGVKRVGKFFFYLKATEGTTYIDPSYASRREEINANDRNIGAYHYAHPSPTPGSATAEANFFLSVAKPQPGDIIPALDLEVNEHNMSEDALSDWVAEWFGVVFAYIGCQKGLLYTHFNLTRHPSGVYLWASRYNNDNRAPVVAKSFHTWLLWQFTDGVYGNPAATPGIGHVDASTINMLFKIFKPSLLIIPAVTPPPPPPTTGPTPPPPAPTPAPLDRMNPANYFIGANGPWVTWLGTRLVLWGFGQHYTTGPGPVFTTADQANVQDFQEAQGWTGSDADGFPGVQTLTILSGNPPKPKKVDPITTMIAVEQGQVGYHEGRDKNGTWNNVQKYSPAVASLTWSQGQPWCATFQSWCAQTAGLGGYYPCTASTNTGAAWFKSRNQWSEYPAIGAQVFFGSNGHMVHTGFVYNYDATYVYTIEGNTNTNGSAEGDGVYRKKRLRRDPYVQGYGYPKIPGVRLKSADPTY